MSGIEIAGIVLGAIPLVIAGLGPYADGLNTIQDIFNYKDIVKNLVSDFRVIDFRFRDICEQLSCSLQLPTADIQRMMSTSPDTHAIWQDPEYGLDRKLRSVLDDTRYSTYNDLSLRIFQSVDIFREQSGLDENMKPRWIDKSGSTNEKRRTKIIRRATKSWKPIALGVRHHTIHAHLTKIDKDLTAIETLIGSKVDIEPFGNRPRQQSLVRSWSEAREHVHSSFKALRWQCTCATKHVVNLRLTAQNSLEQKHQASYQFGILVSQGEGNTSSRTIWKIAEIKSSEQSQSSPGFVSSQLSSSSNLPGQTISCLCAALNGAPNYMHYIGYIFDKAHRYDVSASSENRDWPILTSKDVSDAHGLIPSQSGTKQDVLSTRSVFRVAVILAYSVLSLHTTHWSNEHWSKRDIYFVNDRKSPMTETAYGSSAPDATPQNRSGAVSNVPRRLRNASIFSLGVTSLELAYKQPSEAMIIPDDHDPKGNANSALENAAFRLADEVESIQGPRFASAVMRCLRCDFRTDMNLEKSELQTAFLKEAVMPLEACYNAIIKPI